MTARIGITKNGIKEQCTVEYPAPCSRHISHSLDLKPVKKDFDLPIQVDDTLHEVVSLEDYSSYNEVTREDVINHLNKISEYADNSVKTYTKLINDLNESHAEGTKRLAALRNMTVAEYEKWLSVEEKDKGLWLKAVADDNDVITEAKWATPMGDTVEISSDGDYDGQSTEFKWFIGNKLFETKSINRTFTADDADEMEDFIMTNLVR